jgi:hypothetical protein
MPHPNRWWSRSIWISWSFSKEQNDSIEERSGLNGQENLTKAFVLLVLITAAVTYAKMPASHESKSDAEKIASALQAGPKFVTQNATVLDYPTSPGSKFRILRAGTNGWNLSSGSSRGRP